MKNISNIKDCYGCGLCATVCPRNIIDVDLNIDGFYEPQIIDANLCTNCGLCLSICSYVDNHISLDSKVSPKGYAAWSNDPVVRRECSSGGVGFELGRYLMSKGYKVCGVRYNPQGNRAEHYIAVKPEELIPAIGSKYIQSYTVDGFKQIDRRQKYLVTGSPCQIDSFRRYIRKFKCEDNFVLMDFFCHGVPSKLMWNKYLAGVEKNTGKVTYASWRNKCIGLHDSRMMCIDGGGNCGESVNWHDSYNILIKGEHSSYNNQLSQGDMFFRMFLSDICLGKACYDKCKYKHLSSAADIRIGDLWGKTFSSDEKGISGVITLTKKGEETLHSIGSLSLQNCDIDVVTEGQSKKHIERPLLSYAANRMLKTNCKMTAFKPILFVQRLIKCVKRYIK